MINHDIFTWQELDQLQAIWELTLDWETHWADWKTGSFVEIQTEAMEDHVNNLFRKLNKFSRELKVRVISRVSMDDR